jgi:hypothetical protein
MWLMLYHRLTTNISVVKVTMSYDLICQQEAIKSILSRNVNIFTTQCIYIRVRQLEKYKHATASEIMYTTW